MQNAFFLNIFRRKVCVYEKFVVILQAFSRERARERRNI